MKVDLDENDSKDIRIKDVFLGKNINKDDAILLKIASSVNIDVNNLDILNSINSIKEDTKKNGVTLDSMGLKMIEEIEKKHAETKILADEASRSGISYLADNYEVKYSAYDTVLQLIKGSIKKVEDKSKEENALMLDGLKQYDEIIEKSKEDIKNLALKQEEMTLRNADLNLQIDEIKPVYERCLKKNETLTLQELELQDKFDAYSTSKVNIEMCKEKIEKFSKLMNSGKENFDAVSEFIKLAEGIPELNSKKAVDSINKLKESQEKFESSLLLDKRAKELEVQSNGAKDKNDVLTLKSMANELNKSYKTELKEYSKSVDGVKDNLVKEFKELIKSYESEIKIINNSIKDVQKENTQAKEQIKASKELLDLGSEEYKKNQEEIRNIVVAELPVIQQNLKNTEEYRNIHEKKCMENIAKLPEFAKKTSEELMNDITVTLRKLDLPSYDSYIDKDFKIKVNNPKDNTTQEVNLLSNDLEKLGLKKAQVSFIKKLVAETDANTVIKDARKPQISVHIDNDSTDDKSFNKVSVIASHYEYNPLNPKVSAVEFDISNLIVGSFASTRGPSDISFYKADKNVFREECSTELIGKLNAVSNESSTNKLIEEYFKSDDKSEYKKSFELFKETLTPKEFTDKIVKPMSEKVIGITLGKMGVDGKLNSKSRKNIANEVVELFSPLCQNEQQKKNLEKVSEKFVSDMAKDEKKLSSIDAVIKFVSDIFQYIYDKISEKVSSKSHQEIVDQKIIDTIKSNLNSKEITDEVKNRNMQKQVEMHTR